MSRFSRGYCSLGVARLPAPFTGDQSLNMLIGKVIANGGAPYVDLWDPEASRHLPLFAAGGSLFGFHEVGIHLFELVWMLALALAVRVTAEHFLESRVAISLAPAFTVGFYYAIATSLHLTQAEVLVGLPLLLSLASRRRRFGRTLDTESRGSSPRGCSQEPYSSSRAPYVLLPVNFWVLGSVELRRASNKGLIPEILRLTWPLFAGDWYPCP